MVRVFRLLSSWFCRKYKFPHDTFSQISVILLPYLVREWGNVTLPCSGAKDGEKGQDMWVQSWCPKSNTSDMSSWEDRVYQPGHEQLCPNGRSLICDWSWEPAARVEAKSTWRTSVKLLGWPQSEEKESWSWPCFLQKVNFWKNQSLNGEKWKHTIK